MTTVSRNTDHFDTGIKFVGKWNQLNIVTLFVLLENQPVQFLYQNFTFYFNPYTMISQYNMTSKVDEMLALSRNLHTTHNINNLKFKVFVDITTSILYV